MSSNKREEENNFLLPTVKEVYSFKWNKLVFEDEKPFIFHDTRLDLEHEVIFDMWENKFDIKNKIHFNKYSQIHYEHDQKCVPFILRFENINGVIERGRDLKRQHYFKPTALIQTSLIYDIFSKFEDKICDNLKIPYNDLVDTRGLFRINHTQKLPINRVMYFRNLLVCFETVEKIVHRRKEKYCLVARVIFGEVLLDDNE